MVASASTGEGWSSTLVRELRVHKPSGMATKKKKFVFYFVKTFILGISWIDSVCLYVHSVISTLFAASWTGAFQARLSMKFSSQESGAGCHFLLRGLPHPGIEPASFASLHWQAGSSPAEPPGKFLMTLLATSSSGPVGHMPSSLHQS